MDEKAFLPLMSQFAFKKVGKIVSEGDRLVFKLDHPGTDRGFVYLWVELSAEAVAIVYVGKAGKTLNDRFTQHTGGFTGSPTGRAHAARLRSGIAADKQYEVYARKSATAEILGEAGISMACAEELAFIQKFKPLWNAPSPNDPTEKNKKSEH